MHAEKPSRAPQGFRNSEVEVELSTFLTKDQPVRTICLLKGSLCSLAMCAHLSAKQKS